MLTPHDNPYADKGRPVFPNHNSNVYPPQEDIVEMVPAFTEEEYQDKPDVVFGLREGLLPPRDYPLPGSGLRQPYSGDPHPECPHRRRTVADALDKESHGGHRRGLCGSYAAWSPGVIKQKLNFYTIVFGRVDNGEPTPVMEQVCADLIDCGIDGMLTNNPLQAGIRKFFRVSILSGLECAYNLDAGGVTANPECRALFKKMGMELMQIAEAIGAPFEDDPCAEAILTMWDIMPNYRTSMKLDYDNGKDPEYQTQIFDVVELGRKYGWPWMGYTTVARMLGYKG